MWMMIQGQQGSPSGTIRGEVTDPNHVIGTKQSYDVYQGCSDSSSSKIDIVGVAHLLYLRGAVLCILQRVFDDRRPKSPGSDRIDHRPRCTLIRINASCFLLIRHGDSSLSIVRIIKEEDRSLVHHTTPIHTPYIISQLGTIHPSTFLLIRTSSTMKDVAGSIDASIPTPRIPEYRTGQLTSRPAGQSGRRPWSRERDLCSG